MGEINMKQAWIAFWVTLGLVLPIRIFAMLRYMNPQTGFYSDGGWVVGAASVLLIAGILLTVFFGGRAAVSESGTEPLKNIPAAVLGAFAGIFILVQSVVGIGAGILGAGQIFYQIYSYMGILAGGVLLVTAYDLATGQRTVASRPLLALIPSLWGCFFLVVLFITYSAVVNLVEDVYHTFTVVFLLLFLFAQAKLLTGIENAKTGKMIYMAGFPAALLALVTGVPSCVQYFGTGKTAGFISIGLHMANIMLALYIIAFLFALRSAKEQMPLPSAQQPEKSAEAVEKPDDGGNSLDAYTAFLTKAYGSGEKFVETGISPFYTPDEFAAEES